MKRYKFCILSDEKIDLRPKMYVNLEYPRGIYFYQEFNDLLLENFVTIKCIEGHRNYHF